MSGIRGVRGDAGAIGAVLVVVLAVVAPGCAPKPADDATTSDAAMTEEAMTGEAMTGEELSGAVTPETARQAGQLAAAIEREPARLAELLAEQGWTADAYEALLVEIAADPGLTDVYEAARTGS